MKIRQTLVTEERLICHYAITGETFGLSPEDFSSDQHGLLWELITQLRAEFSQCDAYLLSQTMSDRWGIDQSESVHAMFERSAAVPAELMAKYADSLHEAVEQERLSGTLENLSTMDGDCAEIRGRAMAALQERNRSGKVQLIRPVEALRTVFENMEKRIEHPGLQGVTTGLPSADRALGGWHKTDLTLIAARPAVGKTALMCSLAISAARAGKVVGIISAEQPCEQLYHRMLSMLSGVPAWKLRNPVEMSDQEQQALYAASKEVKDWSLVISDKSSPDMAGVRGAVLMAAPDLVLVDYVQRLKGRGLSRYDQVSDVAMGLKEIARDLEVPVVALSQINRAGGSDAGMEHLKGSGDLEQEADQIGILGRDEGSDVASLNFSKNRHGPNFTVPLSFNLRTMLFAEIDRRYEP